MRHATFSTPDLTVFCRLGELGLEVVGQRVESDRAWLACRIVEPDDFCHRCGVQATVRDTVTRQLAHAPFGHRPTTLLVRVRRYRCEHCRRAWRQDMTRAAEPRSKLSHGGREWALAALILQAVIDSLRSGVPEPLTALRRLGRTLHRRAGDVLAYFDLPGTSNGPTEAINGRLEHLRGSALGFRNISNYITRSLLESGGFRPLLHSRLR